MHTARLNASIVLVGRDAAAGDVECPAVVGQGADDGQSEGVVHALVERGQFH
jgi:hypothetical protein